MATIFTGFSVKAQWPERWPEGRLLAEECRHITLAFLGEITAKQIARLNQAPRPAFETTPAGIFDKPLLLPPKKPRMIAWHTRFLKEAERVYAYQETLRQWLAGEGFATDSRPFLPHVTLARSPFDKTAWQSAFKPLPFVLTGLHCYQSMGNSNYKILWTIEEY